MTQETLAEMLGVRRTTVTLLAQALKEKGLIRYSRGHLVITNRKSLESSACECYHAVHHDRLPVTLASSYKTLRKREPQMPMYYFHLYDDVAIRDDEGLELIDLAAARDHAAGVARELTFKSTDFMEQNWSNWTMRVHDHDGTELFSLVMSDFQAGNHNP